MTCTKLGNISPAPGKAESSEDPVVSVGPFHPSLRSAQIFPWLPEANLSGSGSDLDLSKYPRLEHKPQGGHRLIQVHPH